MYKSYFFLGLGVGLIISGSVFMFFSDKTEKVAVTPETEFVETEKKESLESEEFKKLLREIEELKTDEKTESSKTEGKNLAESNSEDSGKEAEKTDEKKEEKTLEEKTENTVKDETEKDSIEKIEEETKAEEKKETISIITETDTDKKIEEEKAKETVEKTVEIKKAVEIKKGKITVLEDNEKNTAEYKISAEKYQIQFRSSKSKGDCERIKDILKDVIDTEIVFLGEYYRVFSSEMFSKEISYDVADKIGKIYNLKPIVWFSDYTLIFKEDKNIKNCEALQKRIARYIDTTIKFENNVYILSTKNPLPKNLAVDIAEYINNDITLDIIIKQSA